MIPSQGSGFTNDLGRAIVRHMYPYYVNNLKLDVYKAAYEDPDSHESCLVCRVPYNVDDETLLRCDQVHEVGTLRCQNVITCSRRWCAREKVPKCAQCNALVCQLSVDEYCYACGAIKCPRCAEVCDTCEAHLCMSHGSRICAGCIARNEYRDETRRRGERIDEATWRQVYYDALHNADVTKNAL